MKQYKITADFGQDEPVGTVLTVGRGTLDYTSRSNCTTRIYPHMIATMPKLGFLEEVKGEKEWSPWNLKIGDTYWITSNGGAYDISWNNDKYDHYHRGTGFIFRTEEESQAKYKESMSKGKGV